MNDDNDSSSNPRSIEECDNSTANSVGAVDDSSCCRVIRQPLDCGKTQQNSLPQNREQSPFDKLTVFQAAPLVWRDHTDALHPVEMLDFDQEREVISEALSDAAAEGRAIEVVYETATTDRLASFLALDDSHTQVLHFSCHGLQNGLCFEDGCGGAQVLLADDLRELMSLGSGEPLFVFVSACYSRATGEAFVRAGCKHVLCCQQDDQLMDAAAAEFSRIFYRSLAIGHNLLDAFELGRQAVRLSPRVVDSEKQMNKFLLLPEGDDHNVPIFYSKTKRRSCKSMSRGSFSSWLLPQPPHEFIGREMEMYDILQALKRARLVRVTGPSGIGKSSLAAAVCRYINVRDRTFPYDDIIWLPLLHSSRTDALSSSFRLLFELLESKNGVGDICHSGQYSHVCGVINETLRKTKTLMVIDAKSVHGADFIERLMSFFHDLFLGTNDVKVILLLEKSGFQISSEANYIEREVALDALDFKATSILFGKMCSYIPERRYTEVCTPRQLSNFLVPRGQEHIRVNTAGISKRSLDLFEMLGKGNPAMIRVVAREMQAHEFDMLITIGKRKEAPKFSTRAELESERRKLKRKLKNAKKQQSYKVAAELKTSILELEKSRDSLRSSSDLSAEILAAQAELDAAISSENFDLADSICQNLCSLEGKLQSERDTEWELTANKSDSTESSVHSGTSSSASDAAFNECSGCDPAAPQSVEDANMPGRGEKEIKDATGPYVGTDERTSILNARTAGNSQPCVPVHADLGEMSDVLVTRNPETRLMLRDSTMTTRNEDKEKGRECSCDWDFRPCICCCACGWEGNSQIVSGPNSSHESDPTPPKPNSGDESRDTKSCWIFNWYFKFCRGCRWWGASNFYLREHDTP